MTKAAKTKKSKAKSGTTRAARKPLDFELVRKRISSLVGTQAVGLVKSAIDEAEKGHFAAMKYLFEMIGLYPADGEDEAPGEESLARTLLQRLGVPEEPAAERFETKGNVAPSAARGADAVE